MGAKVTFDPADRHIYVTQAPVGGVITLNIKVDLYSDGKEDWLADPNLQKMKFPIRPIGGDTIPGGVLGDTYVIEGGWTIAPYETDHELILDGNIFAEAGELVSDTVGAYRVRVTSKVSTLVEVRETGVSGLTAPESAALVDLSVNVALMELSTAMMRKILDNRLETDPATGVMTLYDDDGLTPIRSWDVWEDVQAIQAYRSQGSERRDAPVVIP